MLRNSEALLPGLTLGFCPWTPWVIRSSPGPQAGRVRLGQPSASHNVGVPTVECCSPVPPLRKVWRGTDFKENFKWKAFISLARALWQELKTWSLTDIPFSYFSSFVWKKIFCQKDPLPWNTHNMFKVTNPGVQEPEGSTYLPRPSLLKVVKCTPFETNNVHIHASLCPGPWRVPFRCCASPPPHFLTWCYSPG